MSYGVVVVGRRAGPLPVTRRRSELDVVGRRGTVEVVAVQVAADLRLHDLQRLPAAGQRPGVDGGLQDVDGEVDATERVRRGQHDVGARREAHLAETRIDRRDGELAAFAGGARRAHRGRADREHARVWRPRQCSPDWMVPVHEGIRVMPLLPAQAGSGSPALQIVLDDVIRRGVRVRDDDLGGRCSSCRPSRSPGTQARR